MSTQSSVSVFSLSPTTSVRMVVHSLSPVFWVQADFVGKRKISVGDLLEYSHLPRSKYLLLPVRAVGQDLTTHFMCPWGTFLTSGMQ